MIAYYPRLREGAEPGLVPKFGGLPWGLPARLWPTCRECGRPMSHLAQLPHAPPSLPIGSELVLFLFKCEYDSVCSFWEHGGGANAAFAVPAVDLGDRPAQSPVQADEGPRVLREIGVVDWVETDDEVPAESEDAYYDFDAFEALPARLRFPHDGASDWQTKSGGTPSWAMRSGAQCIGGFPPGRLLLQIDTWLRLEGGEDAEIANFCCDGTAYVFVDRAPANPVFSMFINR